MLFGVEFWLKIISKGLLILCALKLQKHFSNIYMCVGAEEVFLCHWTLDQGWVKDCL